MIASSVGLWLGPLSLAIEAPPAEHRDTKSIALIDTNTNVASQLAS